MEILSAILVIMIGIVFTRNLMDLARKKYVVEEGIYQAYFIVLEGVLQYK